MREGQTESEPNLAVRVDVLWSLEGVLDKISKETKASFCDRMASFSIQNQKESFH